MTIKHSTFVPKAFDLTELDARIKAAQAQHDKHKVLFAPASEALAEYDHLVKDGYVRDPSFPVLTQALDVMQAWLQITLIKPKKVITRELEQIAVEVEAQYKAEIKAEQQDAIKRMQQRLLAEAEEKELREAAEHRAQAEAAALAEAASILGLKE